MIGRLWTSLKLFLSYIFPFFPSCPAIGKLEDGDCIFVQAFGRNSISDDDLGKTIWEILSKTKTLSEAFTLLSYSGFDPGKSNIVLAKRAMELVRNHPRPIIAQWEVVYCIWKINLGWFLDNLEEIDCLWPPKLGYYATWHVKLESREKMRRRGRNRPIELCHPAMAARAIAIILKLKINVIAESISIFGFWKNCLWVFDENSVQPWTTSFFRVAHPSKWWLARESFGRYIHHPLKGWISFILPR